MDLNTAKNSQNGNLGNIKYAFFQTSDTTLNWKPFELLKSKWTELELNRIYLVRIVCGSDYVALVQKYTSHAHGSAIIMSYQKDNPIYVILNNNVWVEERKLITNSDLGIVYHPNIAIPSTKTSIESWIKSNIGTLNRFNVVRSNPPSGSEAGIFPGNTSFCILWQCSSPAYGWITLYSDNISRPIVYGVMNSAITWSVPTLTQI